MICLSSDSLPIAFGTEYYKVLDIVGSVDLACDDGECRQITVAFNYNETEGDQYVGGGFLQISDKSAVQQASQDQLPNIKG